MVVSECLRDGKETIEIRYYISSLGVSVKHLPTPSAATGVLKIAVIGVSMSPIARTNRAFRISTCVRTLHGSIG